MATLKITTNIPDLEVVLFDNRLQLLPDKYRCTSNPDYDNPQVIEQHAEINLKAGLYKVMLELPYCYPVDLEDHKKGKKMSRFLATKLIDLPNEDSVIFLRFNAMFS